jgi:predicted lactoylglutathione lyase
MIHHIYINLPVADLPQAVAFYTALGFTLNPQFSSEAGGGFSISDSISLMLTTHAKFREFTPKAVCDTTQAVEVLNSLACSNRSEVDDLVARALAAGGTTYDEPEDLGFMYSHSFVDLDGHGWGVLCMTEAPPPA